MSFLDLAKKRCSVRGYTDEEVSVEDLNAVLEAGRLAPSAANFQPWNFIVVRDPVMKTKLKEAYGKEWFWKAPVIIVVCVSSLQAWSRIDGKNYARVDGAIAMDHITLGAADLGLGTCWIGAFDPIKLRRILSIPSEIEPIGMTPLGKPATKPLAKKRKSLSEIVHYDHWQE